MQSQLGPAPYANQATRASRYASQVSSTRSTQVSHFNPFAKKWTLPPHVEDILHAKQHGQLRELHVKGQGLYTPNDLLPSLDRRLRPLPWERANRVSTRTSRSESLADVGTSRSKSGFGRQRKVTQHSNKVEGNKYIKLFDIIEGNPYGKIAFTNSNEPMHPIASWVTQRLEHSCRSARFALPSDYRLLENMTTLDYLEKYTVLTAAQRRRYDLVFAKFMDKTDKCIYLERLYPALNSMFANSLGKENFEILCTALFIGPDFKISSKELFAGISALTERLFWSSYLES
ncbi:serine/arginine repetitive matrix protein 1-like, partial [Elysia marginata]